MMMMMMMMITFRVKWSGSCELTHQRRSSATPAVVYSRSFHPDIDHSSTNTSSCWRRRVVFMTRAWTPHRSRKYNGFLSRRCEQIVNYVYQLTTVSDAAAACVILVTCVSTFVTSDNGGGKCDCPRCLSVCLFCLSVCKITQKRVHGFG